MDSYKSLATINISTCPKPEYEGHISQTGAGTKDGDHLELYQPFSWQYKNFRQV